MVCLKHITAAVVLLVSIQIMDHTFRVKLYQTKKLQKRKKPIKQKTIIKEADLFLAFHKKVKKLSRVLVIIETI